MNYSARKVLQAGTVSPLLLMNWFFGNGVIEYPIGRPRFVLSAFWSFGNLLIIYGFLRMANFSELVKFHGSIIVANLYCTNAHLCTTFVTTSICFGLLRAKVVKECREKLNIINDRLKMLAIPNDYEMDARTQITQIIVVFAVNFFMVILDFRYIAFDLPSESSRIGFLVVFHYSLIFAFVADGEFTTSIRYLGSRFEHLNTLLADTDPPDKNKSNITRESDDQSQLYFPIISEIHRSNLVAIGAAKKQWRSDVIRETRMIHRALCKVATKLNQAYGIQVLFSVTLCFGLITALVYTSYIIGLLSLSDSFLNNWIIKIIVLSWITVYFIKILVIVHACDTTSSEANRTGGLISKLLYTAATEGDICDELLQNPLNFTASGFFTLNYSLVHGIIGSVTTYLVILIQMRNIYDPENVNSSFDSTMSVQINCTT